MEHRDKLKRHFFLTAIIIAFLLMIIGQMPLYLLMLYLKTVISDSGIIFLIFYSTFLGIWPLTLLYCRLAEKDVFKKMKSAGCGGGSGNTFKKLLIGLLAGITINGICALAAYLHRDLAFSFSSLNIPYLVIGLLAVFIQSGAEELVTRGYLFNVISARYSMIFAVIINSLFFAVIHGANKGITLSAVLQLFLFAITESLIVWKYDSLWMAMGLHTGWNYTQSLLLGLPNSGIVSEKALLKLDAASDSIFYSVSFGLEGGITILILLLAISVFIILTTKRKENAES